MKDQADLDDVRRLSLAILERLVGTRRDVGVIACINVAVQIFQDDDPHLSNVEALEKLMTIVRSTCEGEKGRVQS